MSKMTERQIEIMKEEITAIKDNLAKTARKNAGLDKNLESEAIVMIKTTKKFTWRV